MCKADVTQPKHPYPEYDPEAPPDAAAADEHTPLLPSSFPHFSLHSHPTSSQEQQGQELRFAEDASLHSQPQPLITGPASAQRTRSTILPDAASTPFRSLGMSWNAFPLIYRREREDGR